MAQRRSSSSTRRKKGQKPESTPEISIQKPDPELDLATKMIEKEHELENNLSAKVVHELISIYSEAIEYYSHKNDSKYIDLQLRMHNIIKRPDILLALKSETARYEARRSSARVVGSPSSPLLVKEQAESPKLLTGSDQGLEEAKENTETIEKVNQSTQNDEDMEKILVKDQDEVNEDIKLTEPETPEISGELKKTINIPVSTSLPHLPASDKLRISERLGKQLSGKNLGIIIDRHSNTNKNTANRAAADFKSQDSALQRRLASRQKMKMNHSMSFSACNLNDSAEVFKCDISEVLEFNEASTKTSCFIVEEQLDECERFEKMLEEILEKNYCERAKKIAEIKVKYEGQITEMSGMGDFMKTVVEQMRKSMQEEINDVVMEYDNKKKDDIAALKSSYV